MGRRPSEELLVALAGPAVNVVIAVVLGVGLAALGLPVLEPVGVNVWPVFPQALFMTNVGLVVFNLLPAFPMDGGRVLRALLEIGIGRLPATQVAALVGAGLALLIGVGGLFSGNLMLCFLAGMVFLLGQQELAAVSLQERRPVGPTVLDMLPAGPLSIDPASYPARPGFSGFTWDARNRLWVEWRDGRPVGGVAVDRS
jgi:Zn-dependent protease